MPRPHKQRRIRGRPNAHYFKPAGVRVIDLDEIILTIPEFEALRLVDVEKHEQVNAAEEMHISQPTFSRILKTAREKTAQAIVQGKAIKIEKPN